MTGAAKRRKKIQQYKVWGGGHGMCVVNCVCVCKGRRWAHQCKDQSSCVLRACLYVVHAYVEMLGGILELCRGSIWSCILCILWCCYHYMLLHIFQCQSIAVLHKCLVVATIIADKSPCKNDNMWKVFFSHSAFIIILPSLGMNESLQSSIQKYPHKPKSVTEILW